jgi:hypothetical protein
MTPWFIMFSARNTPSCKEVIRIISDSMDSTPSFKQRIAVRLHILICKWCARYQRQLLLIRSLLRGRSGKIEENTLGNISPEARERMKGALNRNIP